MRKKKFLTTVVVFAVAFACGLILGRTLHRRWTIELEWTNKRVEWYNRELENDLYRLRHELDSLHRLIN